MYKEQIESGINGSKLILEKNEIIDVGYKARMLLENHIPGFLECNMIHEDGCDRYVYDITSKSSIYNIYEHDEMDYKILYDLIGSIACGLESASEYLLKTEHLILDPKYIYVENDTGRIYWCYYPGHYCPLKDGMNELAEYILSRADHKDDAATSLAYGFYKQVVNEDYTIRKLLSKHEEMTVSVIGKNMDDGQEENILIEDDRELYTPDENDAPMIPRSGKIIMIVCMLIILLLSGFVLSALLYKNGAAAKLLVLNEMKVFICLTEALAMMLPILITARWLDQSRRFKKLLMKTDNRGDKDLYRQVCFGHDCLNP